MSVHWFRNANSMTKASKQPVHRLRQTCARIIAGDSTIKASRQPVQPVHRFSHADSMIKSSKQPVRQLRKACAPVQQPRFHDQNRETTGAPAQADLCTGSDRQIPPTRCTDLSTRCTCFRGRSSIISHPPAGAPVVKCCCTKRTTFLPQNTTENEPVHDGAGLSAGAPVREIGAAPV